MQQILYIFIGGGLGSLVRYYLSRAINASFVSLLPLGTLASNVLASLIVGLFAGFVSSKGLEASSLRMLIVVGFCGGFSTFSTFSNETLTLLTTGQLGAGLLNIVLNVTLCLLATFFGFAIFRNM